MERFGKQIAPQRLQGWLPELGGRATFGAPWAENGAETVAIGTPRVSKIAPKIEKWHPNRHPKIDAEKVMENDAKMMRKLIQELMFFAKG